MNHSIINEVETKVFHRWVVHLGVPVMSELSAMYFVCVCVCVCVWYRGQLLRGALRGRLRGPPTKGWPQGPHTLYATRADANKKICINFILRVGAASRKTWTIAFNPLENERSLSAQGLSWLLNRHVSSSAATTTTSTTTTYSLSPRCFQGQDVPLEAPH